MPDALPPPEPEHRHTLAFLATLSFIGGFFGARLFHTTFPAVMIIIGDSHFHHFWYGLGMMGLAGWLGIARKDDKHVRTYAVIFGLGVGFVGDEVGLLVTWGDYYSTVTTDFFIAAMAVIIIVTLLLRYWDEIVRDVIRASPDDRLIQLGIFAVGFSAMFFIFGQWQLGTIALAVGAVLLVFGVTAKRRASSETAS